MHLYCQVISCWCGAPWSALWLKYYWGFMFPGHCLNRYKTIIAQIWHTYTCTITRQVSLIGDAKDHNSIVFQPQQVCGLLWSEFPVIHCSWNTHNNTYVIFWDMNACQHNTPFMHVRYVYWWECSLIFSHDLYSRGCNPIRWCSNGTGGSSGYPHHCHLLHLGCCRHCLLSGMPCIQLHLQEKEVSY